MNETAKAKWKQTLAALSVPKALTSLCLLALGVNGLVQVGLQHDMSAKAQLLSRQVAQTETLSTQMKDGLSGLSDLQASSAHMAATLGTLHQETSGMSQGLTTLGTTVSGIQDAVQKVGVSTQASGDTISEAQQATKQLLDVLNQINHVNSGMIDNLNQMIGDQKAINQNLSVLNQKTAILPQLNLGGGK